MAETLGSLTDKLTIRSIRKSYINRMLTSGRAKSSKTKLQKKLAILKKQKELLIKEIEEFIVLALKRGIQLKDDKLKLYNKPQLVGKIGKVNSISRAIDGLSKKNLQLWHLEDEARREDVPLSYIGKIKRKIDIANQQRNDFIDKIDELFSKKIKVINKKK